MTAAELLAWQIDDSGFQIEKALEGLAPDERDCRIHEGAMSPNEVVAHLCECYVACAAHVGGGKHEWGSFKFGDESWEERLARWGDLRAKAKTAALAGDEEALQSGYLYIVGHDVYHVGQLCQLRLHLDPDWPFMSIYR